LVRSIFDFSLEKCTTQNARPFLKPTGFWGVGNKKEPSEKDSFVIGLMVVI
jgi:hypothetical protein